MPRLTFNEKEILVDGEATVNASGNIYIENGRKYRGKKVRWVILKEQGSNRVSKSPRTRFEKRGMNAINRRIKGEK